VIYGFLFVVFCIVLSAFVGLLGEWESLDGSPLPLRVSSIENKNESEYSAYD